MYRIKNPEVSLIPSTKGKEMLNVNNFLFFLKETKELTGTFIGNAVRVVYSDQVL